jgi:hypothetical protein
LAISEQFFPEFDSVSIEIMEYGAESMQRKAMNAW